MTVLRRSRHPTDLAHTLAWIRCITHVRDADRPCGRCRRLARIDVAEHGERLIEATTHILADLDGYGSPTPLTYAAAGELLRRVVPADPTGGTPVNALLALTAAATGVLSVTAARLAFLVRDPNRRLIAFTAVGVLAAAGIVITVAAIRSAR